MSERKITVYGAHWCPDCRRSKAFLGEHQIPYHWIDVEQDPDAEHEVMRLNGGRRIIPTIVFDDGSFLVEPSNAELASKLGLKTVASRSFYPHIVVGGGPAGLTAALYTAREGIDTLVIERAAFGGQAAVTERLDNLPGFPQSIAGLEFSNRLRDQAVKFGVELLQAQDVVGVCSQEDYRTVITADGAEYSSCALLVATGARYKRLNVPGESDYIGAGVHFCATCDGPFYRDRRVAVIGGGNSATEESLFLTKFASHVTMIVRSTEFRASKVAQQAVLDDPKIDVVWNTEVREFIGENAKLRALRLENRATGEESVMDVAGAFLFVGQSPNSTFLSASGVRLDTRGFIVTGHDLVHDGDRPAGYETRDPMFLETSVPGIFAAGDVRAGSTKQVASASGEGATAALLVREYLKTV